MSSMSIFNSSSVNTSVVRMKALASLPNSSPVEWSTWRVVAKPFLMLMDHSASEESTANPETYTDEFIA